MQNFCANIALLKKFFLLIQEQSLLNVDLKLSKAFTTIITILKKKLSKQKRKQRNNEFTELVLVYQVGLSNFHTKLLQKSVPQFRLNFVE